MTNAFIALIFRMRNIKRWGMMFTSYDEDLAQHTSECAFMVHYLASIGITYYNKKYCVEKLTVCALFHDIAEIFTGDIPTPVKYYNLESRKIFRDLEKKALDTLMEQLPLEVRSLYSRYINIKSLSNSERKLLKAADRLCAYVKCLKEVENGNKDFSSVSLTILKDIESMKSDEAEYFLKNCIKAFKIYDEDLF